LSVWWKILSTAQRSMNGNNSSLKSSYCIQFEDDLSYPLDVNKHGGPNIWLQEEIISHALLPQRNLVYFSWAGSRRVDGLHMWRTRKELSVFENSDRDDQCLAEHAALHGVWSPFIRASLGDPAFVGPHWCGWGARQTCIAGRLGLGRYRIYTWPI
jgi:hypothetical protein